LRGLRERFRRHGVLLTAALVAYVPIIASSPGAVGADTKTYLYLDPGRVLANASTLWDSDVALGTVTHQNIGYLWPMGPFYWVFETIGSPDWFAQRIWLGSLLFAAGAGVHFLLKTLDWQGRGMLVAVLAYQLSPYILDYSARISAVLLPWAGLPWMIALTIRAARSGGWRDPARFALVVLTVGSVNATSLLLVGLAPVAWLIHARVTERSITTRQGVTAALRIGVLSAVVSLWWIAGLILQGGYSLPVTRYTETYQTVAAASTAPEVFRGLGYWFFYGNDKFGPWIQPSIEYTQGVWLLFISFGLVVLSLFGAALVRWRHRSYFVLLIVMGGLIAIGSHPFDAPSPLGSLFKDFTGTDAGLALRSTPRALPMLVLATSVLLGTVVNALDRRWPQPTKVFAVVVLAAVVLNNPAMWKVRMVEENLQRDEEVPEYWLEAIDALNESERQGRVMELPGSDFASYRWGNTVDPITPGFLDRGYVARELVPFGSAESANLLNAFDRRLQEGTADADSIVPIAQMLSIDDIVHRADLTFERFRTPRPVPTAELLDQFAGLGSPVPFGEPVPNVAGPQQTLIDQVHLAIDPTLPHPAPVTAYEVPTPLPEVRLRPISGALVIVGDAEGIVDAAGAGLLEIDRPLWFGADLALDDSLRDEVLAEPAVIVLTDTHKRRAHRWGTLREGLGYVERPGEEKLVDDPTDNRLELFTDVEASATVDIDDTRTVSVQPGPFVLRASNYGNPVTYTNGDRPSRVIDGDPATAWVVGAFAEARGEWLEFAYEEPTVVPSITLVQPAGDHNRRITEVVVRADGEEVGGARLDPSSWNPPGQKIALRPHEPASVYELDLVDLSIAPRVNYAGVAPVGFAEVLMGNAPPVAESLRLPVAFMSRVGADLDRHDLSIVMTRERSNPQEPVRTDPEPEIQRDVELPSFRTFAVEGAARVSATVDKQLVDELLGRATGIDGSPLVARASATLPGDLNSLASFAFDGDRDTAWTPNLGPQREQWIEIETLGAVTFADLRLAIVIDELHSVPTRLAVEVDGELIGEFETGLTLTAPERGTLADVVLPVSGSGSVIRVRVVDVAERLTRDWYSNAFTALPVSFAEIEADAGVRFGPVGDVATGCVEIATISGQPVRAEISGSAVDALERKELTIAGCTELAVDAHFSVSTAGRALGFDIDQLVLRSHRPLADPVALPPVTVVSHDDTNYVLEVPGDPNERWLVLGQSVNVGWEASIDGVSLGEPTLIDGFANGWRLPAGAMLRVELEWTPQSLVNKSLALSVVAILFVIGLAWRGRGGRPVNEPARAMGPAQPTLRLLPLVDRPSRQRAVDDRIILATSAVAGGLAWLNLPRLPVLALGVGLALALLMRLARGWIRPSLFAAFALGFTSVALMLEQRTNRFPPDFGWPQQFLDLHVWGLLALLLLAADYLYAATTPDEDRRRPKRRSSN